MDEIENEPQIIGEQNEIILKQPEIFEKEKLLEKKRIHARIMKEKRSDRLNELHECACGGTYSMRRRRRRYYTNTILIIIICFIYILFGTDHCSI
jgi:hypothetical protein